MAPGASAKVWIPSLLGYGDEGAGDMIPPNSDLTFDLQVLQILGRNSKKEMVHSDPPESFSVPKNSRSFFCNIQ